MLSATRSTDKSMTTSTPSGFSKKSLLDYTASQRGSFEKTLKELVEIPSVSAEPRHQTEVAEVVSRAADLLQQMEVTSTSSRRAAIPCYMGVSIRAPTTRPSPCTTTSTYSLRRCRTAGTPSLFDSSRKRIATGDGGRRTIKVPRSPRSGAPNTPSLTKRRSMCTFSGRRKRRSEAPISSRPSGGTKSCSRQTRSLYPIQSGCRARAPACPAGLRGLQGFRFFLETGETDQHSGTAGGAARNPVAEVCQLVADCFDAKTGEVKIPGFYDDVVEPTEAELADLKKSGFSTATFKKDHQFKSLRVTDPVEIMKRIWCMPTFEVHGIEGGYQGPGVKTVVPPRATAIVSCRLVPDMGTRKIVKLVKAFVKEKNPDVKVEAEHGLPAYQGHTAGPHPDAIRAAMKFAFDKEPVFVREGGSIGAVVSMEKVLKAPVLFLGLSLPEHGYHAPNENYDWQQAEGGMIAFADYFRRVAAMEPAT